MSSARAFNRSVTRRRSQQFALHSRNRFRFEPSMKGWNNRDDDGVSSSNRVRICEPHDRADKSEAKGKECDAEESTVEDLRLNRKRAEPS